MKKLALILAGTLAACGSVQTKESTLDDVVREKQIVKKTKVVPIPKETKNLQFKRGSKYVTYNPKHILRVTYDPYHFKFESMNGEFEHAELYDGLGKSDFCFESLKMSGRFLFYRGNISFYNKQCDPNKNQVDQINFSEYYREIKRPKNQLEVIRFYSLFKAADSIFSNFKKEYKVEEIRKDWLKKKDSCKKKCYFDVEHNHKKKLPGY